MPRRRPKQSTTWIDRLQAINAPPAPLTKKEQQRFETLRENFPDPEPAIGSYCVKVHGRWVQASTL